MEGHLFFYNEPSDEWDEETAEFVSLFLAFSACNINEIGGLMRATETYATGERFCFWRGSFDTDSFCHS